MIADHHKSVFVCQVLDRETGEVKNPTLESRREVLRPFLEDLPDPNEVFIEACRSWEWVSDLCGDVGADFRLIDPRQMPEIAKSTKKSVFVKDEWRATMRAELSEMSWFFLESLLLRLDFVDAQRDLFDKNVKKVAAYNENYQRLQKIPGIGPVIAATILAEVPHAKAFKTARHFASYAGLVPSVRSSAGKARHGRITKSGPRDLRWALCQAVMVGQRSSKSNPHTLPMIPTPQRST